MKVVTILGARPQFIKASPVSKALKEEGIEEVIVHTGQHFDENMSKVFFDEMKIPAPKYSLDIHGLSHGAMTGKMLEEIEKVLMVEKPDIVVVYGDTNSTLAGALAAKKLNIKVAHIEAGLRSFNMKMPEEINRILTDRISDLLFCPTESAIKNLEKEGFAEMPCQVLNAGDVMLDAFNHFRVISDEQSKILENLQIKNKEYVLFTVHRQENTESNSFDRIIEIVEWLSTKIKVVWPVHPRVKNMLTNLGQNRNTFLIEPVGYLDMVQLILGSNLIVTDSGGLQKEAFFGGKFCVTLREETEWIELVESGCNKLCGTDISRFKQSFAGFDGQNFDKKFNFYGSGLASKKIALSLRDN